MAIVATGEMEPRVPPVKSKVMASTVRGDSVNGLEGTARRGDLRLARNPHELQQLPPVRVIRTKSGRPAFCTVRARSRHRCGTGTREEASGTQRHSRRASKSFGARRLPSGGDNQAEMSGNPILFHHFGHRWVYPLV